MTITLRILLVLALTLVLSWLAYHSALFDALYSSQGWQAAYIWLAARFRVIGPEQGDNLVMAMTLGLAWLAASVGVTLGLYAVHGFRQRRKTEAK